MKPLSALPLCLLPFVLACAPGEASANGGGGLNGKLTLTGSSTVAPAISDLAKQFEALHPGLRIDVQTGGSSRGIRDATSGLAHIGMSSRALKDSERGPIESVTFAQDGVCFLVHASNPVGEIADADLRRIFTGELDDWSEVGGPQGAITVINRAEGRSELSLVGEYLDIEADQFAADAIAGENQQGIKQVASDPLAIVYMSVGTSEYEVESGTPIKMLPLRGVASSAETVGNGSYPLARPLILITQPDAPEAAQAFLEFVCSEAAHAVIRDHAFVPAAR